MKVEIGNESYEVTIDEQNSIISVDGYKLPIIHAFGYTYKCCKRPLAIVAPTANLQMTL